MYTLVYALCFYLSSLLITIPFLKFFRHTEARFVSLLAASLVTFLLGYVLPFKISFYAVFAALMLLSLYQLRSAKIDRSEIIFAAVFAFFIFLRFLNPYIQDAEKFMDSAFMNAVLKAQHLPPNDPFFAGGKLDFYYYFGHVISACITLMSFSPPEVGYNIAIAALPAYSALIIYGILVERGWQTALAGIVLTIFSGNAYSFYNFFYRIFSGIPIDGGYYWYSTRVINNTINEFPYFSFIHADLHAHVVAIPIILLIISLCYIVLRSESEIVPAVTLTAALFILFATNSWDYPLLAVACIAVAIAGRRKELVIAVLLSVPFVFFLYSSMNTPAAKFELVTERTDILQFLGYALTPLLLAYISAGNRTTLYALLPSLPTYFLSPILPVLLPLALSSVHDIIKKSANAAVILVGLLAFIIPEFVAVESRMNTVFKFYLVGWLVLMTASAANVELTKFRKYLIVALLIVSIVYPLAATPVRYSTRELTLDGMSFMRYYEGDYEAVKWLQSKQGVVIEEGCTQGALCAYKYGGRVAAFTGNPAVIAWTNHEYVWRRNYTMIAKRAEDVRRFYSSSSCYEMEKIVQKYKIKYIFVGYEERKVFNVTPKKFERCFEIAFHSGKTWVFTKNLS